MADTSTTGDRVWGSVTNDRGLKGRKLVAMRRDYFRRLAKARLLNTPDAPAIAAYLKRLDEELGRRKITIQNPELN